MKYEKVNFLSLWQSESCCVTSMASVRSC